MGLGQMGKWWFIDFCFVSLMREITNASVPACHSPKMCDSTTHDDSTTCSESESRLSHQHKAKDNCYIFVSLNPANERCRFKYKLPDDKPGRIEMVNLTGEMMAKINLKLKSKEVNYSTSHLNEGFYFFRLISDNKIIGFGKLVIVR